MRMENPAPTRVSVGLNGAALAVQFVLQRNQLSEPGHPLSRSLMNLVTPSEISLEGLLASGKSLIRWGDGDTMSALGLPNSFEPRNLELASELIGILRRASSETNFVLGLPISFLSYRYRRDIPTARLRPWGLTLLLLSECLKEPVEVFDSFAFKNTKGVPRLSRIENLASVLEKVASKPLVAVGPTLTTETIRSVSGRTLAGEVIVPHSRAYRNVDDISEKVQNLLNLYPDALFLVSAGSTGRIVIARLCGSGQFLDIGQIAR